MKDGTAPVAVVIPRGFGQNPLPFGGGPDRPTIRLLTDSSDVVAANRLRPASESCHDLVAGTCWPSRVQSTWNSLPAVLRENSATESRNGSGNFDNGGTEASRRRRRTAVVGQSPTRPTAQGLVAVATRDVVGENKQNPIISFYAAAIGVMFLLFTASGASARCWRKRKAAHWIACWLARHDGRAAGRQAGLQRSVGLLATRADVRVGLARFQG